MPTLKQDNIIEIQGWVMLNRLGPGHYRIRDVVKLNGIPMYTFARPRGRRGIISHYCDFVDPWVQPAGSPHLNKIIIVDGPLKRPRYLRSGDPCPTPRCGRRLALASPSGAYLECSEEHVHGTRIRCQEPGCRRLATSFQVHITHGRRATCAEHDTWPLYGPPRRPRP
jgi:hypothetical protein